MFKKILVTTDGSESNRYAIDDGLSLAKSLNAEVTALCVFDVGSYGNVMGYGLGDVSGYVAEASEHAFKYVKEQGEKMGVKIKPLMLTGRPADTIIEESKNYDLIVCGTLGRTGVQKVLMGSVAEKVVRMAECPVLVCRKPSE